MSKENFEMMLGLDYGEEGLDSYPLTKAQLLVIKMVTGFKPEYVAAIDDVDLGSYYNDIELAWLLVKMQPIINELKQKQADGYFEEEDAIAEIQIDLVNFLNESFRKKDKNE